MFIHDALLEAVLCGQSEVSARALQSTILALESPVEDGSGLTGMDLEFKVEYPAGLGCGSFESWSLRLSC